ncbi:helix-turn-helix transcriptional regulator [Candidatus Woesearchaeota archaeon]|nr:helix-turn-helix transcriptional regulator [Candidatus Woesearchaeota archaeon]
MAKEKFLLVSLKEDESKRLAQVMANDTSRKILDYLADKEATESELSKKLKVPISTVHYNLQALVKGKLVEAEEFHYSKKGKEVMHYTLANKYIIIAPKSTFGLKQKLRSILPVFVVALLGSYILSFFNFGQQIAEPKAFATRAMADESVAEAAIAPVVNIVQPLGLHPAVWFMIGAVFTVVLFIVVEYIIYKVRK